MELTIGWVTLGICLVLGIYTAFIIKKEKAVAKSNELKYSINKVNYSTPPWWSIKNQEALMHTFHRTDTRYEWLGTFQFIENTANDPEEFLSSYIDSEKIIFDAHEVEYEKDVKSLAIENEIQDSIRVQGCATKNQESRLYLDIYILKLKTAKGLYFFESRSSVLNGSVEGPYFEDLIWNLTMKV